MRLGAPLFLKSEDPEELAREHRRLGYGAAYCPPLSLDEPERVRAVREAFARSDVVISEVGAWCNMMSPNPAERRANLDYVSERLALADAVGALCCVNVAGSFSSENWYGPHPEDLSQAAFELTVENVRTVIDSVRPRRTRFTLETMPWTYPDSADAYLRLLAAVDRPAFAVHLDPVNLVNCPQRYYDTTSLLQECFQKLGPWIVSCHAKDVRMLSKPTLHLDEVRPGQGHLDYATYLSALARLPGDVPLMLEHLPNAEEYALAAAHIRAVAEQNQLQFN